MANVAKRIPQLANMPLIFQDLELKKDDKSESLLEVVLKKMVAELRILDGRCAKTSFVIIDFQSVKNTDKAENKGYDAGKKVSLQLIRTVFRTQLVSLQLMLPIETVP